MSDIEFRDLKGMDEFRTAEALQRTVWGDGDLPDPADLLMVIQAEGGLVGGAFLEGNLVGYVFGFPSAAAGVQHSHRLAVLPQMRGRGLGLELKRFQRRWCLARGIGHVRWTYDPMRPTNAGLNITRLGARAKTYHVDYYGEMAGINRGLPSDRLLVDWFVDDADVELLAQGLPRATLPAEVLRIALPANAEALLRDGGDEAIAARITLREVLQQAFAAGLVIVDFDMAGKEYVLAAA